MNAPSSHLARSATDILPGSLPLPFAAVARSRDGRPPSIECSSPATVAGVVARGLLVAVRFSFPGLSASPFFVGIALTVAEDDMCDDLFGCVLNALGSRAFSSGLLSDMFAASTDLPSTRTLLPVIVVAIVFAGLPSPATSFPATRTVVGAEDDKYDVLLEYFSYALDILVAGIVSVGLFSLETFFPATRTVAGAEDDEYDVLLEYFSYALEILAAGIVSVGLSSPETSFLATRTVVRVEDDGYDVLFACIPNSFEVLAAGIVSVGRLFAGIVSVGVPSPSTSFRATRTVARAEVDKYDPLFGCFFKEFGRPARSSRLVFSSFDFSSRSSLSVSFGRGGIGRRRWPSARLLLERIG